VKLPYDNAAVYPVDDGRLIVRHKGRIHLLDADGRVLDSRTEPSALRNATLLNP
jgi:hypothetical protein